MTNMKQPSPLQRAGTCQSCVQNALDRRGERDSTALQSGAKPSVRSETGIGVHVHDDFTLTTEPEVDARISAQVKNLPRPYRQVLQALAQRSLVGIEKAACRALVLRGLDVPLGGVIDDAGRT